MIRLRKKKTNKRFVTCGVEVDGRFVYCVVCEDNAPVAVRKYEDSEANRAISLALKDAPAGSAIRIGINGPVMARETSFSSMNASNPTVVKALVKNAAESEMAGTEYTSARVVPGGDPATTRIALLGMMGTSEMESLFATLGPLQSFTLPIQGVNQRDGVHLHLGHKGAALYCVQGGVVKKSSFLNALSCDLLEGGGSTTNGGASPEEKAKLVTDWLRRLTQSVSQDLTGWRRDDPSIPNRIYAHGAGAALAILARSFELMEIEVEVLDGSDAPEHKGNPGPESPIGPEYQIAYCAAIDDAVEETRSFVNPLWQTDRLERMRTRTSRTRIARIAVMSFGILALSVVPTLLAASSKAEAKSSMASQSAELTKYQPVLTVYKSITTESKPIQTVKANTPDWTKVWQFIKATQPATASVRNVSMAENTPGVITVNFSATIVSQQPFAPIVAWINAMESHGAAAVQTSTMTYEANNQLQTTAFSLELKVGSVSGAGAANTGSGGPVGTAGGLG